MRRHPPVRNGDAEAAHGPTYIAVSSCACRAPALRLPCSCRKRPEAGTRPTTGTGDPCRSGAWPRGSPVGAPVTHRIRGAWQRGTVASLRRAATTDRDGQWRTVRPRCPPGTVTAAYGTSWSCLQVGAPEYLSRCNRRACPVRSVCPSLQPAPRQARPISAAALLHVRRQRIRAVPSGAVQQTSVRETLHDPAQRIRTQGT